MQLHLRATAALSGFFVDTDAEDGISVELEATSGPLGLRFVGYTDGTGIDDELVDSELYCTASMTIPKRFLEEFSAFWRQINNNDPRALFSSDTDWITHENPYDLRHSSYAAILKTLTSRIDSLPEMSVPEPESWPEHMLRIVQSAYRNLQVDVFKLMSKVQWVQAQTLAHDSIVYWSDEAWSLDRKNWKLLPFYAESDDSIQPEGKPLDKAGILELIGRVGPVEDTPLSFELLGEATQLARSQPHLAYIVAVSACEVRASEVCTIAGGVYQWLSNKRNPPSVAEFATAVLPMILAERGVSFRVQAIPPELVKHLRRAVENRNEIVHRGSALADGEESEVWSMLNHVRDYLYFTYYYFGEDWALKGLSDKSQRYLQRQR